MATVASLQIKLGADVSAAINGLTKAEFAARKVQRAYTKANETSIQAGFVIAGWAANVSLAANQVQKSLDGINLENLDDDSKDSVSRLKNIVSEVQRLSGTVTSMGAAFSGAQQVAGAALGTIARIAPTIAPSLIALAGPIGLVVGGIAALTAGYLSQQATARTLVTEKEKLLQSITDEQAKAGAMFATLREGNLTQTQRASLIKQINSEYGTTLKNLSDEQKFIAQIDAGYQAVAKSIENKILLAGSQKELEDLIRQNIELKKSEQALKQIEQGAKKYNTELLKIGANASQVAGADFFKSIAGAQEDVTQQIVDNNVLITDKVKEISEISREVLTSAIGSGGKAAETEGQKIQKVLDNLANGLEQIRIKAAEGIIGDAFGAQVDEISKALNNILNINPNSAQVKESFSALLADYKALVDRSPIEISILPTISPVSLDSLNEIPDRAVQVREEIRKVFAEKIRAAGLLDDVVTDFEKLSQTVNQFAGIASQVTSVFQAFESNNVEKRSQELDAYYERQKTLIEQTPQLESVKNKKLEQLDKEVAQKRKQIQRDQAAANKRKAIFEALINTARAVAEALPNIPLSVLAGALGAAQVAAIASQPLPALAKGGLVSGPTAVLVGEYPGAQSNPEFISPVKTAQKYIREAVREEGGIQELYSYVSGDDLVLIGKRGEYRNQRLR